MSQIIKPTIAEKHPLAALGVFGHIQFADYSLNVGNIAMVKYHENGAVHVYLLSGSRLEFTGEDAKAFETAVNDAATALLRQMQQQIVAVPPGTRIANH